MTPPFVPSDATSAKLAGTNLVGRRLFRLIGDMHRLTVCRESKASADDKVGQLGHQLQDPA
jgi:hypothetical protein